MQLAAQTAALVVLAATDGLDGKIVKENSLGGGMLWELGSDGGKLLAPPADGLFAA
jgi:hypothetical protein